MMLEFALDHWSGLWAYHDSNMAGIAGLHAIVAPPLVFVLATSLYSSHSQEDESLDLRNHYFEVSPKVFSLLAVFVLLSLIADWVILDDVLSGPRALVAYSMMVFPLLALAFTKRAAIHGLVLLLFVFFAVLRMLFGYYRFGAT